MSNDNAKPPVDCDNQANYFLSVDEALLRIRDSLIPLTGYENKHLRDALNRILAKDVLSPLNVPGHVNSAMDGYAVNSADLPDEGTTVLQVIGSSFAGHPFNGSLGRGEVVRIMTGAVVPEGADTVLMQENVQREGDVVTISGGEKAGANVRHIGEDITQGGVVLATGRLLTPADLGLLASLGIAEVAVRRRLRVAMFSTGDELCSIGEPLGDGQIYDSNRYSLHGMLTRIGAEVIDMGIIPDQREAISHAFDTAAANADVLITSGGVSVGEADFVKETLDRLGRVDFWKIAMKPGKPLAFGMLGDTAFFGLPGNPVSAMATFYQIVQASLQHMQGQAQAAALRLRIPCAEKLKKRPGRQDFQRGILFSDTSGNLVVKSTGMQGSHILSSMSQANCFIILPAESGSVEVGGMVEVQPFAGVI